MGFPPAIVFFFSMFVFLLTSNLLRHSPIPTLHKGRPLKLNVGALPEGHAVCDPTKHFRPAITFQISPTWNCKLVCKINTHSPRFRW